MPAPTKASFLEYLKQHSTTTMLGQTECWLWKKATTVSGRPRAAYRGKDLNIQSYLWITILGHPRYDKYKNTPFPSCGNKLCVNPAHLTLIERKDRHRKPGRSVKLRWRNRSFQKEIERRLVVLYECQGKQEDFSMYLADAFNALMEAYVHLYGDVPLGFCPKGCGYVQVRHAKHCPYSDDDDARIWKRPAGWVPIPSMVL